MAWTTPVTKSNGDLVTETLWNSIIDDIDYLGARTNPDSLTNKSGCPLGVGAVVVLSSGSNNAYTTTTTADDELVLGVLPETTASNASGRVSTFGIVSACVQGNVTRGNLLGTSTTLGRAKDAGTKKGPGTFAIALTGYAGGGSSSVSALILSKVTGGELPSNCILYTSLGSVIAGFSEYTAASGRAVVGLMASGSNLGTVGTALTNQQSQTHVHGFVIPNHSHTFSYSSASGTGTAVYALAKNLNTTILTSVTGTASASTDGGSHVLPYVQLMALKKT